MNESNDDKAERLANRIYDSYYANIHCQKGKIPVFMDMTKPRESYPLTEQSTSHLVQARIRCIDDELRGRYKHLPSGKVYEYRGVSWQNTWGLEDPSKYIFINLKDTSIHPNVVLQIDGPNEISVNLITFRDSGSFVKI